MVSFATKPEWRNGRRGGLKNLCRKTCEFESHLGHHSKIDCRPVAQRRGGRPAFVLARGHECAGATSLPKACSKDPLEISDLPQGHFRHDGQLNAAINTKRPNGFTRPTSLFAWWPVRDSNPRHEDFQSSALPTELTGRKCRDNYTSVYRVASRTILKRFQVVFNLCT